ncbi:hypothetical protein [uncultured Serinicoccus sp.]|uniref:hypothetical protein n=1 Tax=uncultured Serinicoccus sp. TaxID=735514 RepID=UPI00262B20BC|nr:hypothetical protein [uncultured Serinicoccus sp.]
MHTRTRTTALALALAAGLSLSACAGDQAEFAQDPPSGSAADQGTEQEEPATDQSDAAQTAAEETQETEEATTVEPAAEQTVEVEESESVSTEEVAFTLTVHRLVVHDYYLEVEVTVVNDGTEPVDTWYGSGNGSTEPRVFDDRGRVHPFAVQAGGDGQRLTLEPGQGVDAGLVFPGRLDPDAEQVTLDFEALGPEWEGLLFEIPLGAAS